MPVNPTTATLQKKPAPEAFPPGCDDETRQKWIGLDGRIGVEYALLTPISVRCN
jgi:hypothetical protein